MSESPGSQGPWLLVTVIFIFVTEAAPSYCVHCRLLGRAQGPVALVTKYTTHQTRAASLPCDTHGRYPGPEPRQVRGRGRGPERP